jgi:hypothetical protein
MIIPINNGESITPIYIPQPVVTTNSGVLEQSNTNIQNNEPTLGDWIVLGVVLIFLIVFVMYFIKLLKVLFGGEE